VSDRCSTPQRRPCRASGPDAGPSHRSPSQNGLLARLPRADYERLLPDLEAVALPAGCIVHSAGGRERSLYFITAGLVSRFHLTATGASAEFAVTGSEGVIGVASFLGGGSTPSQAVVLSAGESYRLATGRLRHEFEHDGPLPRLLLRYTRALIGQMGQVAVCNRHHSLDQRLCRWLLSCIDRLPSNDLTVTHEQIGEALGVRRVGITESVGRLQRAGLIQCSRGRITLLDRPRTECSACECYEVIRRAYDRLLPAKHGAGQVSRSREPCPVGATCAAHAMA
jgi:CRP-like cAMP-binding protein